MTEPKRSIKPEDMLERPIEALDEVIKQQTMDTFSELFDRLWDLTCGCSTLTRHQAKTILT